VRQPAHTHACTRGVAPAFDQNAEDHADTGSGAPMIRSISVRVSRAVAAVRPAR
jgi:hypothetical protein